jgi:hypothetical protein
MIVKIAAWLYIINAALTLSSLAFNPFGIAGASSSNLAILMMTALFGAMGVGLLKQKPWARWLALGSSFLGWTLGALLLILLLGWLVFGVGLAATFGFLFAGGFASLLGAFVLFVLLIWVVSVVINFKLFFYLCSEDGCDEFDVPYGSAATVAVSAVAWIGIFIVNGMMSGGGSLSSLAGGAWSSSDRRDDRTGEQRELDRKREQVEEARRLQREEARRLREAEERARVAAMEASTIRPQATQNTVVEEPEPESEAQLAEPVPATPSNYYQRPAADESEKEEAPASKRILKCRDASGGTTFTQGYCPPGTRQVEMPAHD